MNLVRKHIRIARRRNNFLRNFAGYLMMTVSIGRATDENRSDHQRTGCAHNSNGIRQNAAAKIKLGPPLNGIDGRKAGTFEGYNYSDAMKGSGITWDEAVFKEYIGAPMQKVPGTRMAFAGVRDPKEVEDLWTYLKGFGTDGQKK